MLFQGGLKMKKICPAAVHRESLEHHRDFWLFALQCVTNLCSVNWPLPVLAFSGTRSSLCAHFPVLSAWLFMGSRGKNVSIPKPHKSFSGRKLTFHITSAVEQKGVEGALCAQPVQPSPHPCQGSLFPQLPCQVGCWVKPSTEWAPGVPGCTVWLCYRCTRYRMNLTVCLGKTLHNAQCFEATAIIPEWRMEKSQETLGPTCLKLIEALF